MSYKNLDKVVDPLTGYIYYFDSKSNEIAFVKTK